MNNQSIFNTVFVYLFTGDRQAYLRRDQVCGERGEGKALPGARSGGPLESREGTAYTMLEPNSQAPRCPGNRTSSSA